MKICPWLVGEIRSDHAGETGEIWFYRGVLAVTRDAEVRDFAERHIETEMKHLELLEGWLSLNELLFCLGGKWGVISGALLALFEATSTYSTVEVVEAFVVRRYGAQITILSELKEQRNYVTFSCNALRMK